MQNFSRNPRLADKTIIFSEHEVSKVVVMVTRSGLVTWPFCGLEKNVWPFGSILAFLSSDRNFHYFLV